MSMSLVQRSIRRHSEVLSSQTPIIKALASSLETPPSLASQTMDSGILFASNPTVILISLSLCIAITVCIVRRAKFVAHRG